MLALLTMVAYVYRARHKNSQQPQSLERIDNRLRVADEQTERAARRLLGVHGTEHKLGIESNVVARSIDDVLAKRLQMHERERFEAQAELMRFKALTKSNAARPTPTDDNARGGP